MGKRIALLTSGGDCAGLNAVIRAVVRRAHYEYDFDVMGIRKGTHGLLARPVEIEELKPGHDDTALLRLGGTILGTTNKGDPFAFPMPDGTVKDRSEEIVEGFHALDLDAAGAGTPAEQGERRGDLDDAADPDPHVVAFLDEDLQQERRARFGDAYSVLDGRHDIAGLFDPHRGDVEALLKELDPDIEWH